MIARGPLHGASRRLLLVMGIVAIAIATLSAGGSTAQTTPGTPSPVPCGPAIAATPVVMTLSTPFVITATETPLPAADEATTGTIAAAVGQIASCWNDRDWLGYAALLSPDERARRYGSTDLETALRTLERTNAIGVYQPITLTDARFVRTDGVRLATIEVRWQIGYAVTHELWAFVFVDGGWLMDGATALEPAYTGEVVGISGTIRADSLTVTRASVATTAQISIELANDSPAGATVWLVTLAPGATELALGGDGAGPSVHGARFIPAGEHRTLILNDLPAGDYLLIVGVESAVNSGDPADLRTAPLSVIVPEPSA